MNEYVKKYDVIDAIEWEGADVCEAFDDMRAEFGYSLNIIKDIIRDMRAEDVKSVGHAKWEQFHLGDADYALRLKCTNCHEIVYKRGFNYCPYCGFSMDLEE